jgi:DNA replication protein DnaC
MSVAATLEWLADMELEARWSRHCSPLQVLTLATATQHRCVSLPSPQEPVQAKTRILRLLDLSFLHQGTNLVIIGNAGVGKTFLAKVYGWKACQANKRVLFTTAMDMLNQLSASQVDHSLVPKLKGYTEPTLLICDELGYLALDQQTSNLFYQVISTRHSQKRSTIITTNTPFSDWSNILYNTTIATAIADRLVENSEIFLLGGDSLRKANKNSSSPEA